MLDITTFLNERKSMYQKRIVRLEKSERVARGILKDEPNREDVKESLNDDVKLLDRYNALIDFIEELQEQYFSN